jgi:hypothetical protein
VKGICSQVGEKITWHVGGLRCMRLPAGRDLMKIADARVMMCPRQHACYRLQLCVFDPVITSHDMNPIIRFAACDVLRTFWCRK